MAGRSPARFLAPLALVAFVVALVMIIQAAGNDQSGEEPATNSSKPAATSTATPKTKRKRKVYVVKPGDTPSGIAEKTGVSLEQLEIANPDLDPQLLAPGQRIKLPR
jgi:LysM repeat protein